MRTFPELSWGSLSFAPRPGLLLGNPEMRLSRDSPAALENGASSAMFTSRNGPAAIFSKISTSKRGADGNPAQGHGSFGVWKN
jgi:hypothetical protein